MKIAAFSVRQDEKQYFDTFANVYKVELQINRSGFTADDIESVKGCEAMSVCDGMCDLSAPVLEKLAAEGVKYIGFRTIGYNSVDLEAAKRLGIRVAHSGYSVANYTVMLMLMCIRKALYVMMRSHTADYSLGPICGREMQNMTVGIIGTGRIGKAVINRENHLRFSRKVFVFYRKLFYCVDKKFNQILRFCDDGRILWFL